MAYNYRKVERKILAGEEKGMTKVYGVTKAAGICNMLKLYRLISARSAISSAEVKSVIDNLI